MRCTTGHLQAAVPMPGPPGEKCSEVCGRMSFKQEAVSQHSTRWGPPRVSVFLAWPTPWAGEGSTYPQPGNFWPPAEQANPSNPPSLPTSGFYPLVLHPLPPPQTPKPPT